MACKDLFCQDPENPRKKLYKVFQAIEDTSAAIHEIGSVLKGGGEVPVHGRGSDDQSRGDGRGGC